MLSDKMEILELTRKFTNLCKVNDIWYTLDNGSLLGAVRENDMIPWDDDMDVMMTYESFKKLKKMFPNNIIDTDTKGYPLLIPKFMNNKNDFLTSAVVIDIFLAIPTTRKKAHKFRSFLNKTRFAIQTVHGGWKPYNFASKFFQIISWPIKFFFKSIKYQDAVKMLQDDNSEAIYTIDNPIDPFKINWQENISLERKEVKFNNFMVYIPIEYNKILVNKYGKDYMTPNKQVRKIEHINAVSIKKVKRK